MSLSGQPVHDQQDHAGFPQWCLSLADHADRHPARSGTVLGVGVLGPGATSGCVYADHGVQRVLAELRPGAADDSGWMG